MAKQSKLRNSIIVLQTGISECCLLSLDRNCSSFYIVPCSLAVFTFYILEFPFFAIVRQMYGRIVNRSLIIKRKFIRMKFSFVDMMLRILVDF